MVLRFGILTSALFLMTSIASGAKIRFIEQKSPNFSTSPFSQTGNKEVLYKTEIMRHAVFENSDLKNHEIFNSHYEDSQNQNLYIYGKFSALIDRDPSFFSDQLLSDARFYDALIDNLKVRKIENEGTFFGRMGIKFGFIPVSSIDMNFKLHLSSLSNADHRLIDEAIMLDPDAPSPLKTVVLQSTQVNKIAKDFTLILKIYEDAKGQSFVISYLFSTVDMNQVGRAGSILESSGSNSLIKNAEHMFKSLSK